MSTHSTQQESNTMMIIIIVGLLMIAYMLYSLTVSIYRNYSINTHIQKFELTNSQLQKENENKLKNYQYYTSNEYKDKMAKQNLGLVNPGEEVIVIPPSAQIEEFQLETEETKHEIKIIKLSNLEKWWEFFFVQNKFKY